MQLPRLMPPLKAVLHVFANEGTMRGHEAPLSVRGALKVRGAPQHEDPHAEGRPSPPPPPPRKPTFSSGRHRGVWAQNHK